MELPCSLRSLQKVIVRSRCGFRAEAARRWCVDRSATVPFERVAIAPRGARAGIMQCHLRHVYGLRTYEFSNLYNFPLNKIVEASEPVKPYENLTAASCFRTEASRKPHEKEDTGSVDASQTKCDLGIRCLSKSDVSKRRRKKNIYIKI